MNNGALSTLLPPKLRLVIEGEPKAIQSVRFARRGKFTTKYQPEENTVWKAYIRHAAVTQLPAGWELLDGGVALSVLFVFYPTKAILNNKRKHAILSAGGELYKITKPDLSDNLKKGLNDALSGVVWSDDSRICHELSAKKVYGMRPRIEIEVFEVPSEVCG